MLPREAPWGKSMNAASTNDALVPERVPVELVSIETEAISRLRLLTAVSVLTEIALPAAEAIFSARPDWTAINIEVIWCAITLVLFGATWLRWLAESGNPHRYCLPPC